MNSQVIFAASLENLIILVVIAVISGLHSWWKKKQGDAADEEDGDSPLPPRHPGAPRPGNVPPPPRSPASNWEEELRRLLQGDAPKPAAPPPLRPPPMVVAAPPPMPPAPRPIVRQPAAPLPYLAHSNIPVPLEGDEEETGLPVKMPSLEQSAQAYLRARTLDARVGAQMQQIHQRVTAHIPGIVEIKAASREVQQGLSLLKDRPSLRAALIASIILGPPKALAEG